MNIAYLDPAYSRHLHELAACLAARTGGAVVALLSSPAYRQYVCGDRAIVWQPGRTERLREPPHDFDHAAWAPTHDVRSWQVFSHAVAWFVERFRAERTDICLIFSDARPFSVAARLAADAAGVVCVYLERGAFRSSTSSLSTQGLNGRFSLARAIAGTRIAGMADPGTKALARRATEPWLRTRFARFVLRHALACAIDRDRARMQHKWYSIAHYAKLAVIQWWEKHHHDRVDPAELAALAGRRVVLVPLQLPNDSQLVLYSPFADNQAFLDFVATHVRAAAPDAVLLVKRHPMDASRYRLPTGARWVGGNLSRFYRDSIDPIVVTINSTVGFEALVRGLRVLAFARSFYADAPALALATPSDFAARLCDVLACSGDAAAGTALRAAVLRWYQAPGDTWAFTQEDIEATSEIVLQHYRAARLQLAVPVPDAEPAPRTAATSAASAAIGR